MMLLSAVASHLLNIDESFRLGGMTVSLRNESFDTFFKEHTYRFSWVGAIVAWS